MAENVEAFGGDLDRLVLAGESAGANLISGLTIAACYQRDEPFARAVFETGVVPRITAAACGMLEVTRIERYTKQERVSRFLADRLEEVSAAYIDPERLAEGELDFVNPLVFFERGEEPARPLPAFFLPVGTKDILLDDTRRLGKALSAMNVPNCTCYYPGEIHAFHALIWRKQAQECWKRQFEFLDEHLA
jgi:acetyl esterase